LALQTLSGRFTTFQNPDAVAGSSENLLTTAPVRKSGWHHDLKPENILYFKNRDVPNGEFHIADFGFGKVHMYQSVSVDTRIAHGTTTYEPPDVFTEGATSRPYDIWSLGCVFLELMIWAFYGSQFVMKFTNERRQSRFPDDKTHIELDDGFWLMDDDGALNLRQPVDDWIDKLYDELLQQKLKYFVDVLDLIYRHRQGGQKTMRELMPADRPTALNVWNTLDRIYKQAIVDMRDLTDDSLAAEVETGVMRSSRLSSNAPDHRSPEPTESSTDPHLSALYPGGGVPVLQPVASASTSTQQSTRSTVQPRLPPWRSGAVIGDWHEEDGGIRVWHPSE